MHRTLLDYQSPHFQLKFPLDHRILLNLGLSNIFGSLKSILSFEFLRTSCKNPENILKHLWNI